MLYLACIIPGHGRRLKLERGTPRPVGTAAGTSCRRTRKRCCTTTTPSTTRSTRSTRHTTRFNKAYWLTVGTQKFDAADHIPVLIYPNPLNPKRYVVIDSGHTFGEADFRGTNAWLYPRLGDDSVLTATGDVAVSGFFDEHWQLK